MRESIDRFLSYMTVERGVSPNTVAAYRNDLGQLAEFVGERAPDSETRGWSAVDAHMIASYLLELHSRGYSDTTRARKVASAKSLFAFLIEEGVVDTDPMDNVSSPKLGRSLPDTLTVDEVDALLSAPTGDSPAADRDRAMLELLYASGIRVGELVSLAEDRAMLELLYATIRVGDEQTSAWTRARSDASARARRSGWCRYTTARRMCSEPIWGGAGRRWRRRSPAPPCFSTAAGRD